MQRENFAPDLEQILAPVPGAQPCGPSVRYEPAFLQLRQAREEDDASLPMRVWERPLRKADWSSIARECVALLTRSKDVQLAAWLMDAWVRQRQLEGFNAGTDLFAGLVERYWDGLHPELEGKDSEARVAAFVWLNENMPLTLRVQVPLLFIPDHKPGTLNLAEWEKAIVAVPPSDDVPPEKREQVLTREQLVALVDKRNLHWLSDMHEQLQGAIARWDDLSRALDERLGMDAPSLGKVSDTLRKMQRACASLMDGRDPRAPAVVPAAAQPEPMIEEEPAMPATKTRASAAKAAAPEGPLPTGPIATREDAYRMLEAAAAFLERTEPHSPTPYLVKRAVSWGQMSLADLMQEIVREEGDLSRYFSLLGMNNTRED